MSVQALKDRLVEVVDKLEEWVKVAKLEGVDPRMAAWTFKLARARGKMAIADRALKALESVQYAVDYATLTVPSDAAYQLLMQHAPHPQQFLVAREDLASATELVTAAEIFLAIARAEPTTEPKKSRFGSK